MRIPIPSSRARRSSFSTRFWLAQAAVALSIHGAHAQTATFTWDGGSSLDNKWSTGDNWVGDVAPSNPALPAAFPDIIVLTGTARTTIDVDAPWTIDALNFASGADPFTLSGSAITLQPSNNLNHDSRYFLRNQSGKTVTINNDLVILPALPGTNITTLGSGISVASGTVIFNGNLDFSAVKGSGVRVTGGGGTAIFNGTISGSFGDTFAVNNGATAIFNHANSFVSNFTVWSGTAKTTVDALPGVDGAFGKASNAITMGHGGSPGARLLASAAIEIGRDIGMAANTSNNAYTIGGDTAHVSNFTGTIYNGTTTGASNRAVVTAAEGGRVNITGITRRTGATSDSALLDTVTKNGAGVVVFTGGSDYSGQTNVTAGTLLVNGSLSLNAANSASVGDVVVSPDAVLGGTGFIYRNTLIQDGGILSPGDINAAGESEGGLLTIGVGVTLSNASILRFDLGSPDGSANDEVSVDGSLTLDGILDVTALNGFGIGSYRLFGYGSGFVNNGVTFGDMPVGFDYSLTVDSATSAVYLNVVPEPATGALLGIAGALVLARRRRG